MARPSLHKKRLPSCSTDPYVYENGVLINKLGITKYYELCDAERDLLAEKVATTEKVQPQRIDVSFLKAIHAYIFDDIFDWAGEIRTVNLYKEECFFIPGISLNYTAPEKIESELREAIHQLNSIRWGRKSVDEIATEFATNIAKIWRILPFRDGNTRTIIGFAKAFARKHNFPLDISVFTQVLSRPVKDGYFCGYSFRDMLVGASLDEAPEPEHLIAIFKQAIEKGKQ